MTAEKPLPQITTLDRPFWEHAARHRLYLQCCKNCSRYRFPASPVCADCGGEAYEWAPVSGRGQVLAHVVFHRSYFPGFDDELPYNVASIRLEEGVVMMSNVLAPNETLHSGLPVEVIFEDAAPGIAIPKFKPAPEGMRPAREENTLG